MVSDLLSSRLAHTELTAAVLDGELVKVGDDFWFVDLPCGPAERAMSLDTGLGDGRVIVCDRSAAWVWGWGGLPAALATCVSIEARVPSPLRRRLNTREAVIDDSEVRLLARVRVTDPLRTVIDLVRHDPSDDVIDLVTTAIVRGEVIASTARTELQRRPGIAHLRRARRRLEIAISRC